jgi:hypothetical protein
VDSQRQLVSTTPPQVQLPLEPNSPALDSDGASGALSDSTSADDSDPADGPFMAMMDDAAAPEPGEDDGLTEMEVVLAVLDWMHTHKITDAAADEVWGIIRAVVGTRCSVGTFAKARAIVVKHFDEYVLRCEICVNDCVAYYDVKNIPALRAKYQHSHRTQCPECGEPRWIKDPRLKDRQPRKVVYYFPIARFLRNLYNEPSLVPFLYWNTTDLPDSHVVHSRGFRGKVNENDRMRGDPRNIPLIGNTDGVPFFKDKLRGGWPIIFKVATLPESLGHLMRFCHVAGLQSNDYLDWSEDKTRVVRHVRQPRSLQPILTIMTDDLYKAYWKGTAVTDTSLPRAMRERRIFTCRSPLVSTSWDSVSTPGFGCPLMCLLVSTSRLCLSTCMVISVHSPDWVVQFRYKCVHSSVAVVQ